MPAKSGASHSSKAKAKVLSAKAVRTKAGSKAKAAPKGKVLKTLGKAVSKLVSRKKTPVPAKKAAGKKTAAPVAGKKKDKVVPMPKAAKTATQGKAKDFKKAIGQARTAIEKATAPQKAVSVASAICREVACELMSTTGGYCRMHYIKNWKKIKRKEIILKEKKLNHYIEELVAKYPDKYIEAIRQDLANEKDFAKVIADLEIDEALDDFDIEAPESDEGIIDNLKRFDDDGDVF